mmetsp:Transcript_73173/g.214465  ORF Transcript_73173/g.214465 Transcript_73173/m.214465 type:complete len:203 (-) Transcript_73173:546-1154(-)
MWLSRWQSLWRLLRGHMQRLMVRPARWPLRSPARWPARPLLTCSSKTETWPARRLRRCAAMQPTRRPAKSSVMIMPKRPLPTPSRKPVSWQVWKPPLRMHSLQWLTQLRMARRIGQIPARLTVPRSLWYPRWTLSVPSIHATLRTWSHQRCKISRQAHCLSHMMTALAQYTLVSWNAAGLPAQWQLDLVQALTPLCPRRTMQ